MAEVVDLITRMKVDATAFTEGITKAEEKIGSFTANSTSKFNLLGTAIAGVAVGAIYLLGHAAEESLDSVNQLYLTSQKLGVSVGKLQELQLATHETGISSESLTMMMQQLNKTIGDAELGNNKAIKTFAELGLSVKDLTQLSKDDQLLAVSKAVSKISDSALQSSIGAQVFKRSWRDAMVWVNSDMDGAIKKAHDLNFALTDIQAKNVHELSAKFHEMATELESLGMKALGALAPFATGLMNYIQTVLTFEGNMVKEWIRGIKEGASELAKLEQKQSRGIEVLLEHVAPKWLSDQSLGKATNGLIGQSQVLESQIPSILTSATAEIKTLGTETAIAASTIKEKIKDMSEIGQTLLSAQKSGVSNELKAILGDRLDPDKDKHEMNQWLNSPGKMGAEDGNKFDVLKMQTDDLREQFNESIRDAFDVIKAGGAEKNQIDRILQKSTNLSDGGSTDTGVINDLKKFASEQKDKTPVAKLDIQISLSDDVKAHIVKSGSAEITDGITTYLAQQAASVGK